MSTFDKAESKDNSGEDKAIPCRGHQSSQKDPRGRVPGMNNVCPELLESEQCGAVMVDMSFCMESW